jgi:hypothetical protein
MPLGWVWNHTKYGYLANYFPDDLQDLEFELVWPWMRRANARSWLRSFFHAAELKQ